MMNLTALSATEQAKVRLFESLLRFVDVLPSKAIVDTRDFNKALKLIKEFLDQITGVIGKQLTSVDKNSEIEHNLLDQIALCDLAKKEIAVEQVDTVKLRDHVTRLWNKSIQLRTSFRTQGAEIITSRPKAA